VLKTAEENISKCNERGKRLFIKKLYNLCSAPNISGV
jgi:hypothetical protein